MHKYLIELRIISDWPDEKDISETLGFQASRFVRKGETELGRVASQSVWQLDARPSPNSLEWLSLEDGLVFLLNKLMPVKSAMDELKATCDATICCGHFYSSFGGGPTLSPLVLKRLAEFGVKITISNYWGEETAKGDRSEQPTKELKET